MGRKGRIARLPPEIKAQIDAWIRDGRATIDEMRAHLEEMGVEIPRSTLGDYRKKMSERFQKYREAQEVAGVWVAQLGEQPDSQTGQLLAELLKTVAFRTLADMQDQEAGAEPGELMLLARALKDMAGAQKTDLEFRHRLRAEFAAELAARAKEAEAEVAAVARSAGLTDEAADRIRELVLGVVS